MAKFDEAARLGGGSDAEKLAADTRELEKARLLYEKKVRKAEATDAASRRREAWAPRPFGRDQ